jgi:hypothetical protein
VLVAVIHFGEKTQNSLREMPGILDFEVKTQ